MDWTVIIVAIIAAVPPTIMAAVAALVAYSANQKADLARIKTIEVGTKVETIHVAINSRMDELLRVTKQAATAEATAAEKERAAGESPAASTDAAPTERAPR